MKCKDCTIDCGYRTSDAEKECEFQNRIIQVPDTWQDVRIHAAEGVAYELSIYLNGLYYWNVNNGNLLLEVKGKDNLVDACVDMIIHLNELNLL